MATGIVARDGRLAAVNLVGCVLLWISVVGYIILLVLTLTRVVRFPRRVRADLASQRRGPGFLALVAATCVVGAEFAPINLRVSTGLWLLGATLCVSLTYAFFAAVATCQRKPRHTTGLSGSWLLGVVAAQSVSLLGTLVGSQFGDGERLVLFVSLSIFLSACVLYLALIPLIVHRLEFVSLAPLQFTADYWINMGAMAITTLTGTILVSASERWSFLEQLLPFLVGVTLLFWAGATSWIPFLIVLQAWRVVLRHVPLVYESGYWTIVFPVGMYAASTFALAALVHLDTLAGVARWLAYVALSIWLIAFVGLSRHLFGAARRAVYGGIRR
jgi:tellurite resistance protein TehA-like permease